MPVNPELLQYPELVKVDLQPGSFNSGLLAVKHFRAGEIITRLTGTTPTKKSWSSVQAGLKSDDHIELNSVLVYVNHSCSPNAAFDLSSSNKEEWNFRALRDIQPGEELTFFYPSTEWDMAQGFECKCRAKVINIKIVPTETYDLWISDRTALDTFGAPKISAEYNSWNVGLLVAIFQGYSIDGTLNAFNWV